MLLFGLFISIIAVFIVFSAIDNAVNKRKNDEIQSAIDRSQRYKNQHRLSV